MPILETVGQILEATDTVNKGLEDTKKFLVVMRERFTTWGWMKEGGNGELVLKQFEEVLNRVEIPDKIYERLERIFYSSKLPMYLNLNPGAIVALLVAVFAAVSPAQSTPSIKELGKLQQRIEKEEKESASESQEALRSQIESEGQRMLGVISKLHQELIKKLGFKTEKGKLKSKAEIRAIKIAYGGLFGSVDNDFVRLGLWGKAWNDKPFVEHLANAIGYETNNQVDMAIVPQRYLEFEEKMLRQKCTDENGQIDPIKMKEVTGYSTYREYRGATNQIIVDILNSSQYRQMKEEIKEQGDGIAMETLFRASAPGAEKISPENLRQAIETVKREKFDMSLLWQAFPGKTKEFGHELGALVTLEEYESNSDIAERTRREAARKMAEKKFIS